MAPSRKLVPAVVGIALLSAVVSTGAAVAAPATAGAATALSMPSVIPSWAKTATVVGATADSQTVYLLFTLKQKDVAGEKAYGTAVSTPGSAYYRQGLTKAQFQARFGAVDGAAAGVTSALKGLGITTLTPDAMGLSVMATVPASVASAVFGVKFEQVMHGGQSTRVAMNEPTIPASLNPYIALVDGFSQELVHTDHTTEVPVANPALTSASAPAAEGPTAPALPTGGAPTAYYNAKPASTYYASQLATDKPTSPVLAGDTSTTKPYNTIGYTPKQVRGAYDVDKTKYTGKGTTAGVVLFYDGPDVAADLDQFSVEQGLAVPNYMSYSPESETISIAGGNAPVVSPLAAAAEQTLDVEAIHQMAPDAAIAYSGAVAPEDEPIYLASLTLIAMSVDAINNSYGGTGDTDAMNAMVFQTLVTSTAMTMAVGLDYSSGDSGDDVTADMSREADFPTTSDEVTSVGGTGIEIGATDNYEGEYYWGTYSSPALGATDKTWGPFASQAGGAGGGGGLSTAFAEPAWQQGVVPAEETVNKDTEASYMAANSAEPAFGIAGAPGRVVPDVAMIADSTTGLLVGETQQPDVDAGGTAPGVTPVYSYYRIGGTSVSSPIFTGMMMLVDEALGKSAGFVNPTMYPFDAKHDGAFRDPQIGRAPTASRLGGTMAQTLTGCTADVCTGTGPGVVPVVAQVRSDYTDPANNGMYTGVDDTGSGLLVTSSTAGDPVVTHLRANGILGTLEDLPGYDDSTGLGSPDAPQFIQDFLATPSAPTAPTAPGADPTPSASSSASPTTGAPAPQGAPVTSATGAGTLAHTGLDAGLPLVAVTALVGAAVVVRRRRSQS